MIPVNIKVNRFSKYKDAPSAIHSSVKKKEANDAEGSANWKANIDFL